AELRARTDGLGGDPEVETDVRVHPGEHELRQNRLWSASRVERNLPRMCRSGEPVRVEVRVQRLEVAVRESGVEAFQPRTVLELSFGDGDTDGHGDPLVQRREVA